MEMSALPDPSMAGELELNLDRPFLCEIRTKQCAPLFIGCAPNPTHPRWRRGAAVVAWGGALPLPTVGSNFAELLRVFQISLARGNEKTLETRV